MGVQRAGGEGMVRATGATTAEHAAAGGCKRRGGRAKRGHTYHAGRTQGGALAARGEAEVWRRGSSCSRDQAQARAQGPMSAPGANGRWGRKEGLARGRQRSEGQRSAQNGRKSRPRGARTGLGIQEGRRTRSMVEMAEADPESMLGQPPRLALCEPYIAPAHHVARPARPAGALPVPHPRPRAPCAASQSGAPEWAGLSRWRRVPPRRPHVIRPGSQGKRRSSPGAASNTSSNAEAAADASSSPRRPIDARSPPGPPGEASRGQRWPSRYRPPWPHRSTPPRLSRAGLQ